MISVVVRSVIMFGSVFAARVALLGLTNQVMLLITLTLIRRAVALSPGVVIARAHRLFAVMTALVIWHVMI
jgi:hypothetical protein